MRPVYSCAKCESEIQWGDRFCTNCGEPVEWPSEAGLQQEGAPGEGGTLVCPKCGTQNPADAGYCSSCGTKLGTGQAPSAVKESAGERRPSSRKEQRGGPRKKGEAAPMFSWKVIAIFALIIVVGIALIEYSSGPKTAGPPPQTAAAPAANMQAVAEMEGLEKQVQANPNDMEAVLHVANLAFDNRFYDKAIAYYKRYLEKNPKNADARVDLGVCYYDTGNLDEAQKEMLTALKYDPKHLQGHFNLGIVNLRAGRIKEANEWFKKTIALDPNSDIGQQAKQFLEQHSNPQILPNK
jgi:cytochrome c-type biogenesis protein CcmH/NrfG